MNNNERPYFNHTSADLAQQFDKSKNNISELESLIYEIQFRKKSTKRLQPIVEQANQQIISLKKSAPIKKQPKPKKTSNKVADVSEHYTATQSKKQTKIKDSSTVPYCILESKSSEFDKHLVFKPNFFGHLLGRKQNILQVKHDTLEINSHKFTGHIQRANITSVVIQKHTVSHTIVIGLEDKSKAEVNGLSLRNARKVLELIFWFRYGGALEHSITEFTKLTSGHEYLCDTKIQQFLLKHQTPFKELREIGLKGLGLIDKSRIEALRRLTTGLDEEVKKYNRHFVVMESKKWRSFFSTLEKDALTDSQVESIVTEEDATLVIAGAGTGKTSCVVGKAGYLIASGRANPDNILALAFNRDAAEEMRQRTQSCTDSEIEVKTFHALGMHLVSENLEKKLKISDTATNAKVLMAVIANILVEMKENRIECEAIVEFISQHRYPAKFIEDFDTNVDYLKYLRKIEPYTLQSEKVKSFEELLIADWLTINGIKYEYEKPYHLTTGTRSKHQYRPDFYLPDYQIYIEHFGIRKNGATAPGIDRKKYNEGINWKRELHKQHGSTLIETYSWERFEGVIFPNLIKKLNQHNIFPNPESSIRIFEIAEANKINKKLVSLLTDFLSVYKGDQLTTEDVKESAMLQPKSLRTRSLLFLKIFQHVFKRYEEYLHSRQEIDFSDLISEATKVLEKGDVKLPYSHIIVDEYQDISKGRYRFLKALRKQSGQCKIMCVGDDWQSIYGFTGSNIRMTKHFEEYFGPSSRVALDRTFRFAQPIIDASSRFIQKNDNQIKKIIKGRPADQDSLINIVCDDNHDALGLLLAEINRNRAKRSKVSVLVLGRYNHLKPSNLEDLVTKYPQLEISFMTIHKSKGLQADIVVVLGLVDEKFGFPGSIDTDPIMSLIIANDDSYEHSEERRVLYVAMTRPKQLLYLFTSSFNPSPFIEELKKYDEVTYDNQMDIGGQLLCPTCSSGKLQLKYPNRKKGYAWVCSLGPYCPGKSKFCQDCEAMPIISGKCANSLCKKSK